MSSAPTRQLLLAALAVIPVSAARADIIFDNFGPGDSFGVVGRILEGENVNMIADVDQAASFVVGADGYLLTQISLGINVRSSPAIGTGPLDVILAADDGGLPGLTLQSFTIDVGATGNQVVTAAYPGTLLLEPGTTYWVIADARDTFDGAWNYNSIGDMGPTAGRSNLGAWNPHVPGERYAFRVEGRLVDVVVPESEFALAGLMLLGAGGFTWMRRKREIAVPSEVQGG